MGDTAMGALVPHCADDPDLFVAPGGYCDAGAAAQRRIASVGSDEERRGDPNSIA